MVCFFHAWISDTNILTQNYRTNVQNELEISLLGFQIIVLATGHVA